MKAFWVAMTMLIGVTSLFAQKETYEQQKQREKERWEEQSRKEKEAWEQQAKQERQRWQDMMDRESAAWQTHVEAVKKKWEDIKFSDVRVWVGYSQDNGSRFQADFENGNLKIEVLGGENDSPEALQQRAIEIMHRLLQERMRPDEEPILKDQLEIDPAANQIPTGYVDVNKYRAPDGREYEKMTVKIPFREDHLRVRSRRVVSLVQRYAQKYGINPQLVMAIIHTESSFNPKAISTFRKAGGGTGHAYGLMQLVPAYGGREAYKFLGGRGEPSPAVLFDPEKNIEMGIVYLYKLKQHYFKSVSHLQNKRYLMTAGYNTGPHNVARAFGSQRNINAAIPVINAMEPPRLYSHLLYNLPYAETRAYLRKVTQRISLY